jgi:hypothetical protein
MHFIGFDHAGEQVDQLALLLQCERRQDACLSGEQLGAQISPQLLTARRCAQFACAPVVAVDAPIDQAPGFQFFDNLPHVRPIDAHQPRELALIDARKIVETGKRCILHCPELFTRIGLSDNGRTDLGEAARQRKWDPMRHDRVGGGGDPSPGKAFLKGALMRH